MGQHPQVLGPIPPTLSKTNESNGKSVPIPNQACMSHASKDGFADLTANGWVSLKQNTTRGGVGPPPGWVLGICFSCIFNTETNPFSLSPGFNSIEKLFQQDPN